MESEIELVIGQCLVDRRPGTFEERPLDLDTRVILELGLDEALGMSDRGRVAAAELPVTDTHLGEAETNSDVLGECRCQYGGPDEQGCHPWRGLVEEVISLIWP